MSNSLFNDSCITPNYEASIEVFTKNLTTHIIPNHVTIYAYRVGSGCFHVLKLDNQLEITITDGKVDIPDQENCLDYLRVGHIQIGVLDSMDVTYTIAFILNIFKAQNDGLTYSYLKH